MNQRSPAPVVGTQNNPSETSEEPITIFILKSQLNSLASAESFLRNRKWIVGSSTNLRDALAFIVAKKPTYVLISSDHPNKKVRNLPRMLTEAFPVRVIGFSEVGSGLSTRTLQEMKLEYSLYPPVSGPAIERIVLKIKKDDETKAQQTFEESKLTRFSEIPKGADVVNLKGDASPEAAKISYEKARSALERMGPAIIPGADKSTVSSEHGKSALSPSNPSSSTETDPRFAKTASPVQPASPGSSDPSESRSESGKPSQQAWGYFESSEPDKDGNSRDAKGFQRGSSQWQQAPPAPAPSRKTDVTAKEIPLTDPSNEQKENPGAGRTLKKLPVLDSEYVRRKPKPDYKLHTEVPPEGKKLDSMIVRGTQEALKKTVNQMGPELVEPVKRSSNLACIMVNGKYFRGYLVCAMGRNRKFDKAFINLIQLRLYNFLVANGENLKPDDTLDIRVEEVEFSDWALAQAEFLKKSVHNGEEIAIAFFPSEQLEVFLENSKSNKMQQLSLDEIQEETRLEFDLYIFMPQNNKYLLYTPRGRKVHSEQKTRLRARGVTHVHVRKDSTHELKMYKAQNFLNEKISQYKGRRQ